MVVKMSYCNLRHASRVCRQNEPALILRGRGALLLELWQDFRCRCYRPLYAHRSWRDGDYDYIEYSCGKVNFHFFSSHENKKLIVLQIMVHIVGLVLGNGELHLDLSRFLSHHVFKCLLF